MNPVFISRAAFDDLVKELEESDTSPATAFARSGSMGQTNLRAAWTDLEKCTPDQTRLLFPVKPEKKGFEFL